MRIDKIEIFRVRMPLAQKWHTAAANETSVESIFIRLQSGNHYAWAESTPHAAPLYTPEWAAGVFILLRDWFAPKVIGREIENPKQLNELLSPFKGSQYAKGALDIGWWILDSKIKGIPLFKAIGGTRDSLDVGEAYGVTSSLDKLVEQIQGAVDQGVKRVKLKFCPGWEVEMLHAVRGAFPKLAMHIDCNAGYSLKDKDLLKKVDRFDMIKIEQPLAADDLLGHAELAKYIETPICLDESVSSLNVVKDAVRLGACKWIHMKVARVGGLTAAIEIHDFCQAEGIPCAVGSGLESALGAEITLALSTLPNIKFAASVFNSSRHYQEDLANPPMELKKGSDGFLKAVAADVPGILREPDPVRLEKWCLERASITEAAR